jgi:hypothetical protein
MDARPEITGGQKRDADRLEGLAGADRGPGGVVEGWVGKAGVIAGVEAPGAVEVDDVAEAGGIDGLDGGGGSLQMRGRGLCVDFSREDGNANANGQSGGAQNLTHPGPQDTRTKKTQLNPRGML